MTSAHHLRFPRQRLRRRRGQDQHGGNFRAARPRQRAELVMRGRARVAEDLPHLPRRSSAIHNGGREFVVRRGDHTPEPARHDHPTLWRYRIHRHNVNGLSPHKYGRRSVLHDSLERIEQHPPSGNVQRIRHATPLRCPPSTKSVTRPRPALFRFRS
jgi:hypothetical protein